MPYLLAAIGGVAGALARWGVATALPSPVATLLVNLSGCLLLGMLIAVVAVRLPDASWPRPLLAVGVLGGFTTFSAFGVEVVELVHGGAAWTAAGYVLASVGGGVLAVALGASVGQVLVRGTTR
jgi:CrcB protein